MSREAGWSGEGGGRISQMNAQQGWLAAKKAEIQAKRLAQASSISAYEALARPRLPRTTPTPAGRSPGSSAPPGPSGPVEAEPPTASPPAAPAPTPVPFSNDGSFLAQFQRMQAEQRLAPPAPSAPVSPRPSPPPVTGPAARSTIEGSKLALPLGPAGQPPAQDWYATALARAQQMAQILGQPPTSDAASFQVKREPSASPATVSPLASASSSSAVFKAIPLPVVADELASLVAVNGEQVEEMARERNLEEKELLFLQDPASDLYQCYRAKINDLRTGMKDEKKQARRKSRWGAVDEKTRTPGPSASSVANRSPQLVQYAMKVFGTSDLETHQWKQCEDQMKMSGIYQALLKKQAKKEVMAQSGKRPYEYDSDEDIEGGTWEHKARKLEMQKTSTKAEELTSAAHGRHHIGDFLPPDELKKFISKYEAIQKGETFDESDYLENKLKDDNKGFKMLQKMGWNEGTGLGTSGQGITTPINQGSQSGDKKGLGVVRPDSLEEGDDEFDAYRKRMMLAYRFRPNPLNNPRRAYY